MNGGRRRRPDAPWLLPGVLAVGVPLTALHLTRDVGVRLGLLTFASLVAIGAVAAGIRVNGIPHKLPWLSTLAGLALLAVVNTNGFVATALGVPRVLDIPLSQALQAGGYLALFAGSVAVVVRHTPQDAGGIIDAALIGIGAFAPVWEFVLRPQLQATGSTAGQQAVVLVQMLALCATLGALLRISRTTGRGRRSLRYLFAALACTLAGLLLSVTATDPATGRTLAHVGAFWVVGYLCVGAAALHPSAGGLSMPGAARREELSPVRFAYLGFCLLLTPVVGGIPQLFGQPPDGLLLCVAPLVSVPLVLIRIGQLIRLHTQDQRRLAHQASHDELTGLPNRRHMFTLLESALAGGDRDVAVLYCDLNDFKPINDQLGHEAGDEVLRTVAERLRVCVRADDVVGRIGGDEFLVLCLGAGVTDVDVTRSGIERTLAAPVRWRGMDVRVGTAVGVATAPAGSEISAGALVAAADQAMYADKRAHSPSRSPSTAR